MLSHLKIIFSDNTSDVFSIKYSQDDTMLLAGCGDGNIKVKILYFFIQIGIFYTKWEALVSMEYLWQKWNQIPSNMRNF